MTIFVGRFRVLLACLLSLLSAGLLYLLLPGMHVTVWSIALGILVLLLGYNFIIASLGSRCVIEAVSPLQLSTTLDELNTRIHPLLSIGNVIETLNSFFGSAIPVCNVRYFLSTEFLPDQSVASGLYAWGGAESWMETRLWQFFSETKEVQRRGNTQRRLQEFFEMTDTDVAVPLFHRRHLLGVVLLGCDRSRPFTVEQERELLHFLTVQLPIVLDRIRIYSRVWQSKELAHTDRLQAMRSLSANIAHEMRTPLSGIRASMSGLENYLPQLLNVYESSEEKAKDSPSILPVHLDSLRATPARIALMIDQANAVIDLLLINLKEDETGLLEPCNAEACVRDAVERYPFKPGERALVTMTVDDDFDFMGVEVLMVYVLFNLLKNAQYSISAANKGAINICIKKGKDKNEILFEDTGSGIPETMLAKIFDSFFTTKEEGTGAGLTFCQRTMLQFGGGIRCESVVGEYARFILEFPPVEPAIMNER